MDKNNLDVIDGPAALEALSKEQLIGLVQIYGKNLIAIDGTWFQSVEKEDGMETAMFHDVAAWKRFTVTEAYRIKNFLGLPERAGLEGLAEALTFKSSVVACSYRMERKGQSLYFQIAECRVQAARTRKNMPLHPCKPAGEVEYAGFAHTLDDRITCECLSCYPDLNDESCSCSWKFTLLEEENTGIHP